MIMTNISAYLVLVVLYYISNGEASVLEREKRNSNEWIVTTLVEKPYVTKKGQGTRNEDFEGYIPDLLKKIGDKLNQKYRIREVRDGKYGVFEHGRWNGMMGEVTDGSADVAAAPITITPVRQDAVDFTTPFMTFGTVILMKKPVNSSVAAPKTVHEILVQDQSQVRFGAVNDGSTENLISKSSDADLASLKNRMEGVITTQEQGVAKVRSGQGKYAFVIEENTANYWKRQEPCELTTLTVTQLGTRDYGFALKKGSTLTKDLNRVLKELKDNGELEELKNKWWSGPCSGGSRVGQGALTLATLLAALTYLVKF